MAEARPAARLAARPTAASTARAARGRTAKNAREIEGIEHRIYRTLAPGVDLSKPVWTEATANDSPRVPNAIVLRYAWTIGYEPTDPLTVSDIEDPPTLARHLKRHRSAKLSISAVKYFAELECFLLKHLPNSSYAKYIKKLKEQLDSFDAGTILLANVVSADAQLPPQSNKVNREKWVAPNSNVTSSMPPLRKSLNLMTLIIKPRAATTTGGGSTSRLRHCHHCPLLSVGLLSTGRRAFFAIRLKSGRQVTGRQSVKLLNSSSPILSFCTGLAWTTQGKLLQSRSALGRNSCCNLMSLAEPLAFPNPTVQPGLPPTQCGLNQMMSIRIV